MKESQLANRISNLRYQNVNGKIIPLHHAFKTIHLDRKARASAIILPVLFSSIVWLLLPTIVSFWGDIIDFWMVHIYKGHAGYSVDSILQQQIFIPYPMLTADLPSVALVWLNLIICLLALIFSFLIPPRIAPLSYLLRAIMLIHGSSSIDRILSPDFFPYPLQIYMSDSISLCIYMLFLLPLLLGVVYYIFDFAIWRKCLLTIMMLGFYIIAVPCQYMLHAYIIHECTLLFMPIMYLLFGVLLDVLMFISIYSFGMSWFSNKSGRPGK